MSKVSLSAFTQLCGASFKPRSVRVSLCLLPLRNQLPLQYIFLTPHVSIIHSLNNLSTSINYIYVQWKELSQKNKKKLWVVFRHKATFKKKIKTRSSYETNIHLFFTSLYVVLNSISLKYYVSRNPAERVTGRSFPPLAVEETSMVEIWTKINKICSLAL